MSSYPSKRGQLIWGFESCTLGTSHARQRPAVRAQACSPPHLEAIWRAALARLADDGFHSNSFPAAPLNSGLTAGWQPFEGGLGPFTSPLWRRGFEVSPHVEEPWSIVFMTEPAGTVEWRKSYINTGSPEVTGRPGVVRTSKISPPFTLQIETLERNRQPNSRWVSETGASPRPMKLVFRLANRIYVFPVTL